MGFIIVAKGKQAIFFYSELAWTIVSLGLAWICVTSLGLKGAGIAFFGSYIFHGLMTYPIVHRLSGFRWSTANRQTGLLFFALIAVVFGGFYVLPVVSAASLGVLAVVVSSLYSLRTLVKLVSHEQIPPPLRRLLAGFGLVPSVVAS
jgi:PST family polysaccharide transporter